jgi:HEAT repeat protein
MAMRQALLLVSLVLIVALQGASAPAASSTEPVPLGATQGQVQEALGQPKGQLLVGGMTTWLYEHGQIEFTNGRVDRVQWREITRQPDQRMTNAPAPAAYAGPADARTREITRLTNQLSKGQVNARREAAEKLESLADTRTWDALVKALEDTDGGVQCKALDALCRIDPQRGFDLLASIALEHRDRTFRNAAIHRLSRMHDPRAVAILIRAIGDPASNNSSAAAEGLTYFREAALREAALQQLRGAIQDAEPGMRRNAAMGLGYWGKAAETPLLDALRDPDASVRIAVVAALGKVKSDRSRDALRLLLSDQEASVRYAAEKTLKEMETLMGMEKLKATEKLKEMEKRQIAEARERSEKHRQAAVGLAILCLPGLLALLLVFRVQVLSEPPPLNLLSRILCLASGLSLCVAVIMLFVSFYPSCLFGIHVDAWVLVFLFCLCASFTAMKSLRGAWARAAEGVAGKMPRDADNRLLVNGLLFLAVAICFGSVGYVHMLHWQIGMLTLTVALVISCLIQSAVNLSQRTRVRATVERLLQQDADPEDVPERPVGVALFSLLAMGTGIALITFGYFAITSDIPSMYSNSMSSGYGLLVGLFFLPVGLGALVAGIGAYLLEESGRRLLIRFYALFCASPLLPLSIVALIYLNSRAVKERFQLDEDPDELREKRLRNLFGSWYYVMRGVRR